MKRAKLYVLLLLSCLLCLAGTGGCATSEQDPVVARINGEALHASVLTNYIDQVRYNIGSNTDAALEAYLSDRGTTYDEYWLSLIDFYGSEIVITQRCDELKIEVSDEEINKELSEYREFIGMPTEELWQKFLQTYGQSQEILERDIKYRLRTEKLYEQEITRTGVTPEIVQAYADVYITGYNTKRSSCIFFSDYQEEEAKRVLESILSDPNTDFATAAAQYSNEEKSRARGGDVGWSIFNNLSEEYLDVLDSLAVGEVYPELLYAEGGYCIIKVTAEYRGVLSEDGSADLSHMPEEIYDQLCLDADEFSWSEKCKQYAEDLYKAAEVEILIESAKELS